MEFNVDDITPEEEEEMFQQLQKVVANSTLMSRKVEVDWSEWTNLEYLSETIIAANPLLFGLPADYPCNVHRSRLPKPDVVEDPDVITLDEDGEEDDIQILANDENSNQNMPCQKFPNNNDQDGSENPIPSTSKIVNNDVKNKILDRKYGQGGFQLNEDDLADSWQEVFNSKKSPDPPKDAISVEKESYDPLKMAISVRNQDRKSIEVGQISDGEDDNNKVFKHIRPVTYNVHKTDNEAELKALNDDDWEKIREMKSVDEKKKYAMKAFGNVECGDPSVNRTIHGFLRKRLKSKKASIYQQRIQTETNESMLSVLANNLQSIVKKEKPPIILNDYIRIEDGMIKYPENGNEEESGKKRKASGEHKFAPNRKKPMKEPISFTTYKKDVGRYLYGSKINMIGQFNGRCDDMEMDNIMRHFYRAMEEMSLFFNYYEDISHQDKVDRKELDKIYDIEEVHLKTIKFYGPLPKNNCKDCYYNMYGPSGYHDPDTLKRPKYGRLYHYC